jgi:predicted acyltransferase
MKPTAALRIGSIDVFRAFTMFLMIFVNDLWTLSGIPEWLEHTAAQTDGMGLSDIVFPAFLVVMGMSIPFAIRNRLQRGHSKLLILRHIAGRSLALIVMGVFTVNTPLANSEAMGMSKYWYEIIAVACFFMIWNVYPRLEDNRKYFYLGLQVAGALILLILALIYRGNGSAEGEIVRFQPRWWGILGLIGWAYLGSAVFYLYLKDSVVALFLCWLFFTAFNIAGHAGWFGQGEVFPGNGAFQAFSFSGILATVFMKNLKENGKAGTLIPYVLIAGVILIVSGFVLRNFFIISKILATPPWIMICSGIGLILFAAFYYLVDIKEKESWFTLIKAGGTSTLTCYLIPYLWYDLATIYNLKLPEVFKVGLIGILKSVAFALLIIWITSVLEKVKVKLKI